MTVHVMKTVVGESDVIPLLNLTETFLKPIVRDYNLVAKKKILNSTHLLYFSMS